MTGAPAFLGTCSLCGERGEVIASMRLDMKPRTEVQVPIRTEHTSNPAAIETRTYPERYKPMARCKDRGACDGRRAERERAAWEAERLASQVAAQAPLVQPDEPEAQARPSAVAEREESWFR